MRRAGKLDKARYRLCRSQFLQENMRWKALAEIYAMHYFAPFSILIFCSKNAENLAKNLPFKIFQRLLIQNLSNFSRFWANFVSEVCLNFVGSQECRK